MLTITPRAAEAIKAIVSSSTAPDEEAGLRISTTPVAETVPTLTVSVAQAPKVTDRVVAERGSRVFVDETAAAYVDGKVLDAQTEEGEVRFSLQQPQRP